MHHHPARRRRGVDVLGDGAEASTGVGDPVHDVQYSPDEHPPEAMILFVAQQLGISPAVFADYAFRDRDPQGARGRVAAASPPAGFGLADWRTCLQVGTDAAWATDRGEPIVLAMLAHLRTTNVLLPAAAVLERIGLSARCAQSMLFLGKVIG